MSKPHANRRSLRLVGAFVAMIMAYGVASADQAEEKREAARIKQAEQASTKAKQSANDADQAFKLAVRNARSAEDRRDAASKAIQRTRDEAERALGESTGLPAAIRDVAAADAEFERIAAPIRARVRKSDEYLRAQEAATVARAERERLTADVELDDAALAALITETGKLLRRPDELETAAINADPTVAAQRKTLEAAQRRAAELRAKVKSQIDDAPGLKRAVAELRDAEQDLNAKRTEATKRRAVALAQRTQAQQAANHLADVKSADRRDDANDNKKNAKKKK
ncbi:MAG: hypothetical protein QM811_08905 [Pirellulales bacterium]